METRGLSPCFHLTFGPWRVKQRRPLLYRAPQYARVLSGATLHQLGLFRQLLHPRKAFDPGRNRRATVRTSRDVFLKVFGEHDRPSCLRSPHNGEHNPMLHLYICALDAHTYLENCRILK